MDNLPPTAALRPTVLEAAAAWRHLVEGDREQVERLRENPSGADFYASVAANFRPGVRESLEWPAIEPFARPGDTWLDIGAGGGRFAIPLAGIVERVFAVEPSGAMRATLTEAAAEAGVTNIEVVDAYWPAADWSIEADVTFAAHAMYDIDDVVDFIENMEQHTRRTCIGVFGNQARGAQLARLFEAVHGEPMATLPSLREFVALLGALGRRYEVRTTGTGQDVEPPRPADEAYGVGRRLLWLQPDTEKDRRMCALIDEWYGTSEGVSMPAMRPWIGIVTWEPPR